MRRHEDRRALARGARRSAPRAPGGPAGRGRRSARRAARAAGRWTSARAISRRRRIPPESLSTRVSRRSTRFAISSARSIAARRSRAADPVEVREDEQVLLDGQRRVEVVELRRDAELGARLLRLAREAGSRAPRARPRRRSTAPVRRRIVVDLPAPFGPSRPTQVPSGTSRSRPSTAVIVAVALDDAAQADGEPLRPCGSPALAVEPLVLEIEVARDAEPDVVRDRAATAELEHAPRARRRAARGAAAGSPASGTRCAVVAVVEARPEAVGAEPVERRACARPCPRAPSPRARAPPAARAPPRRADARLRVLALLERRRPRARARG